jgi:hypothetical protein
MGRPPFKAPHTRKTFSLPDALWDRLAEYRFQNRIASEADAVRQVVEAGLDALQQKKAEIKRTQEQSDG